MSTSNLRIFEVEITIVNPAYYCEIPVSGVGNISQEHLAFSPIGLGFCATDDLSSCARVGPKGVDWSCFILSCEH